MTVTQFGQHNKLSRKYWTRK